MWAIRSCLVLCLAAASGAAWADCKSMQSDFDLAMRSKQLATIESAYNLIADDAECDFAIDAFRGRAVEAAIDSLYVASQAPARDATVKFIVDTLSINGNWKLAEKLADYFAKNGQRSLAKDWYEHALDFSRSHPSDAITDAERQELTNNASGAWIVASNDNEGRKPAAVIKSRDVNAGLLAPPVRGAKPVRIPLPINFQFDSAEFTAVGKSAADDLADAIRTQSIASMHLIGHADPRGDKGYNLMLSRQRAEALKAYLLQQLLPSGVTPVIITDGVGDTQPFDVSSLHFTPSPEEVYALDRRVEFLRDAQ